MVAQKQIAEEFGTTVQQVRKLLGDGQLRSQQRSDVDAFITAHLDYSAIADALDFVERPPAKRALPRQVVEVRTPSGRVLAYSWQGDPLAVGDKVLIPGNWLYKEAQVAEVVKLGSDYPGHLDSILRAF